MIKIYVQRRKFCYNLFFYCVIIFFSLIVFSISELYSSKANKKGSEI